MSGDVYRRNRELVTRIYELGLGVAEKNEPVAENLIGSIVPLLRYNGRLLSTLSPKALATAGRIRKENVAYVRRVLQGESIDDVAKDVPEFHPEPKPLTLSRKKSLEDSGKFHIATRILEDGND
ncbi:MAG: hypothetical protein QXM31_00590 [Candidatus Woesearchaeota archaeon]